MVWPSVVVVDPAKLKDMDTRPHYIVRRYAEFSGKLEDATEDWSGDMELTILTDSLTYMHACMQAA
jgi:hypothetical protein